MARAVGVDLLSRKQALPTDMLEQYIAGAASPVSIAAIRAAARAGAAPALAPLISACLRSSSPAVAWEAARALTKAGVLEAYFEIQAGGPLALLLGARGVEILIMAGDDSDIGAFEALLAGTPMSPALLSAIARFGHVAAGSFLLHSLADPELAGAAAAALQTLYGSLVPRSEARRFSAWKSAILGAGFDPAVRYRGGSPWRPLAVLAECTSGELPRAEVEKRIDELAARTGVHSRVDLCLWEPEAQRTLTAFAEQIGTCDARWRPGAWR
jgi:hypothetical protein